MENFFYDVKDSEGLSTYWFSFPNEEEESEQHSGLRISLRSIKAWPPERLKEVLGVERFEDFWTEADQLVAFRKYKGDVMMFIDNVLDHNVVTEVRNSSNEVVWENEKFKVKDEDSLG